MPFRIRSDILGAFNAYRWLWAFATQSSSAPLHKIVQKPDQETKESEHISASCQTDLQSSDSEKDYHEWLLKTAGKTAHEVQAQRKREVFGVHDFRGNDENIRFFNGRIGKSCQSCLSLSGILLSINCLLHSMITLMQLRLASSV